jgi:hypothetical protein
MYVQKSFVEELGFQRIKEKIPGVHPPFILSIKEEFDGNNIISGAFEQRQNHKLLLVVLKQSNTIVLQSEKKGHPYGIMKLEVNSFSIKFIEELTRFYVKNYEII